MFVLNVILNAAKITVWNKNCKYNIIQITTQFAKQETQTRDKGTVEICAPLVLSNRVYSQS